MLKEVDIKTLRFNPFKKIGNDWMLITAGDAQKHNAMTASWGGLGVLWNREVSTIYVRPQRYTYSFLESSECYSLCFFEESYRKALTFCGKNSGRDYDKPKETGLTPNFSLAAPYYEEASLVLICKKLYRQDLEQDAFIDAAIPGVVYQKNDYHRMYIGAIEKVLVKE